MATKWKNISRSGAFKAVLIIAYIVCAAVAGVVTGWGRALCNGSLVDEGLALMFDERDRFERAEYGDRVSLAVSECFSAYYSSKKTLCDYRSIVDSIPFGISITDKNGNVYSNKEMTDPAVYRVNGCDSGHDSDNPAVRIAIELDEENGSLVYDEEQFVYLPDYQRILNLLPFSAAIDTANGIYEPVYYSDSGDWVRLRLVPEKTKGNAAAEELTLTLYGMSEYYINEIPTDNLIYKSVLDKLDFYCRVNMEDGSYYENGVPYARTVMYDAAAVSGALREIGITEISIGLTESESAALALRYENGVHDMRVILITDICLLVLGTAILIYLCRIIGETPDGKAALHPVLSVFYEIPLAATVIAAFCAAAFFVSDNFTHLSPDAWTNRIYLMIICGLAAAGVAVLWLYLWLCMSARSRNGAFVRGCCVYRLLNFLWRTVKRVCGFVVDLFTGKFIRSKGSKRIVFINAVFCAATLVNALLFLLCVRDPFSGSAPSVFFGAFLISTEGVLLVLFIYAQFVISRDISVLERQIEDVYLGKAVSCAEYPERSVFRQSGERLEKLGEQYRRGMEERVRAERMKIDLVTNVSHDLKTPLTSIISYVDLLSKEELPPAAEDYVKILQSKSERLKNIVSDVFELAKATSGEMTAERSPIDLSRLCCQALADMEDKIAASGFEVRRGICDPPVVITSDGKRIYRIIQNLLDNALKYSMEGTRIYFTLEKLGGRAVLTIKNISAAPMEFTAEEITERFVRGDKSRSTDGSGLGLSIAQGFALACGGELKIDIDGDLFRAVVSFPLDNG
ncbi:MAG: sensor histidine kinase [Oscillospiraceae bacterium]